MRYCVKVAENKFGVIKIIALAACLLADLVSLAAIISALSTENYTQIAVYAAIILGVFAIQCAVTFLTHTVVYEYDEGILRITKTYPLLKIQIFEGKKGKYNIAPIDDAVAKAAHADKNIRRLCVNTCPYAIYMLELSGKKYLVNLDDYLYAVATEEENDLS